MSTMMHSFGFVLELIGGTTGLLLSKIGQRNKLSQHKTHFKVGIWTNLLVPDLAQEQCSKKKKKISMTYSGFGFPQQSQESRENLKEAFLKLKFDDPGCKQK